MRQICKTDIKRDIGKVIPGLFPDIDDLIDNHKISDTSSHVVYNNLSEIESVGFRINDDFDAVVLSRAFKAGLVGSSGHGSSQPSGSTAPIGVSNGSPSGSSE